MTTTVEQDNVDQASERLILSRRSALVLIGGAVSTLVACGGESATVLIANSSSSSGASSSSSSSSGSSSSSSSSGTSSSSGSSGTSGAAVLQWAQKDPNPGNLDSYFNGASTSGSPQFGLSQAGYYTSDTTNGNTLLCIAVIATDSHGGPGNTISSVQDPVNGAWTLLGTLDNITDCNCEIKAYVKFSAQPLLTTSWSGTGSNNGAGVLTIGSGTGTLRLGQRINSAHTPAPTNAGGETVIVSLLSGTMGAAGSTYQLNINSTGFSSEAMTTTDFVSQTRSQIFSFTDYPGMFLAELSGTDGSTAYFSGNNDAPTSAGTDTVSSGNLLMASSPGILFGFSFNGGINFENAFPPLYAPNPGTGFTNSQPILQYDQGNPICTVEWQHFSSLGMRAATFSPTAASELATVAVALLDR